jgi:hypothetical protein
MDQEAKHATSDVDSPHLSSHFVRERSDELAHLLQSLACPRGEALLETGMYRRTLDRQSIRCPAEQEMPFVPGGVVHFPKEICAQCPKISAMHD